MKIHTTYPMIVLVILFLYASGRCVGFTTKDHYLLSCGTSSDSTSDGRAWSHDENATFAPLSAFSSTVAASARHDPSAPHGSPYSAARIFNSSFTYTFPVSPGPKFLRLYFLPTVYSSSYDASGFYISVKANDHVLHRNFSARLAVDFIPLTLQLNTTTDRYVIKEYYVPIPSNETSLKLTVSPTPPTSYAFVNGIEVVSVPDTLYVTDNLDTDSPSNPISISPAAALETAYRLNVGGGDETDVNTNMYRLWKGDAPYLFLTLGTSGFTKLPIEYTEQVPDYTAPEHVYQTERHLGGPDPVFNEKHNLTWRFKVDPGFYYMVRLHWCELESHVNTTADRIFEVYINNVTVEDEMDVLARTDGRRDVPVFVDYIVYVTGGDGSGGSVELWIALHPSTRFIRLTTYVSLQPVLA